MENPDARSAAGRLTAATAGNGEEPAGSAAAAGRSVVMQRLPHGKPAHSPWTSGACPQAMHRFPTGLLLLFVMRLYTHIERSRIVKRLFYVNHSFSGSIHIFLCKLLFSWSFTYFHDNHEIKSVLNHKERAV